MGYAHISALLISQRRKTHTESALLATVPLQNGRKVNTSFGGRDMLGAYDWNIYSRQGDFGKISSYLEIIFSISLYSGITASATLCNAWAKQVIRSILSDITESVRVTAFFKSEAACNKQKNSFILDGPIKPKQRRTVKQSWAHRRYGGFLQTLGMENLYLQDQISPGNMLQCKLCVTFSQKTISCQKAFKLQYSQFMQRNVCRQKCSA